MQYSDLTLNAEKIMAAVVAILFAAVTVVLILLYSNSTNLLTSSFEVKGIFAREEVK